MKTWISFCLACMLFMSCGKDVIPADDVELGKDYYPLYAGHYLIYDVDSIIYNDFTKTTDTFKMEFKDEVAEEFTDNEGRPSFVINRFVRQDSTFLWEENLTYYATLTNFRLEVTENNLRFIKLVFPVKLNTSWNGNSYIPLNLSETKWYTGWLYKYENVNEPYKAGDITYTNTVSVPQADLTEGAPDNPNEYSAYTYGKEVYAKQIGLIYRELTRWEYQSSAPSPYRKGFTLILKAKAHN